MRIKRLAGLAAPPQQALQGGAALTPAQKEMLGLMRQFQKTLQKQWLMVPFSFCAGWLVNLTTDIGEANLLRLLGL